jgi:hypothetical protein
MQAFEHYCEARRIQWHQAAPIHVRDWVRTALVNGFSLAAVAIELAAISDAFERIGASDPTMSALVTHELIKHSPLPAPQGWSDAAVSSWKRLPYLLAKFCVEKRREDVIEIQRLKEETRKQNASPASA